MVFQNEHFGPGFRESLLHYYELASAKYGYFIFLPRK